MSLNFSMQSRILPNRAAATPSPHLTGANQSGCDTLPAVTEVDKPLVKTILRREGFWIGPSLQKDIPTSTVSLTSRAVSSPGRIFSACSIYPKPKFVPCSSTQKQSCRTHGDLLLTWYSFKIHPTKN